MQRRSTGRGRTAENGGGRRSRGNDRGNRVAERGNVGLASYGPRGERNDSGRSSGSRGRGPRVTDRTGTAVETRRGSGAGRGVNRGFSRRGEEGNTTLDRHIGRRVSGARRTDEAVKRGARTDSRPQTREERDEFVSDDLIIGRHPVLEALKANRPINKILVADNAEGGSLTEILGKARAKSIIVHRVPRANLPSTPGETNQGIVAYAAPHEYAELEDIIARKTGQPPLVVVLDEISDPYNLGAIIRTADATGVQGVVIPKRRSVPLTGVVAKAAAGALEYVPVARVNNLVSAIDDLKKAGYWIVGTALENAEPHTQVEYTGPTAIVIGSEGQGLSRLVTERCDFLAKLPMLGQLQSLNASVAAGVVLYEVVRQRA